MARVGALWRLGVRHGPKVAAAVAAARVYLKRHPDLPETVRARFDDIVGRVTHAQASPDDAARVRGMLEALRETARLEAEEGEQGVARAEGWLRRANRIERGLALAEQLEGPRRREAFTALKAQADTLVADALQEMTAA